MESLLQAGRPVRVLMTCVSALLAVNAVVLTSQLDADAARGSDAVVEAPPDTVLLVGADGVTISIDPSTPEGRTAIAEAEARGDTIVTDPAAQDAGANEPGAIGATGARPGPGARSVSELDAADGAVDGVVHVVDATGKVVARTIAQVDEDGDGAVDGPTATTSTIPSPAADQPLVEVTIPAVSITIPGVSVTTPPVSVTTPPVTVATPITTVTVATTTVTVPTTTVTVPTTTVTVPTTTVTVSTTTTVTVPPVTTTVPPTTLPPTTIPGL